MNCEQCGEPLADDDDFCPECGTPRQVDRKCVHCGAKVKVKQKYCSACGRSVALWCSCGNQLQPGQKFCRKCGKKVEEEDKSHNCSQCGMAVEEQSAFCTGCGTALSGGASASLSTSAVSHDQAIQPRDEEKWDTDKKEKDEVEGKGKDAKTDAETKHTMVVADSTDMAGPREDVVTAEDTSSAACLGITQDCPEKEAGVDTGVQGAKDAGVKGELDTEDADSTEDNGELVVTDTVSTGDSTVQVVTDTDGTDDTENTDDKGAQGADDTDNTDDKGTQGADNTDSTDNRGVQEADDTDNTDDRGVQEADATDNTEDKGAQEADATDNTEDEGTQGVDATDNTDDKGTQGVDATDNTDDRGVQEADATDNTEDKGAQEADDTDNTEDEGTQGVDATDNTDDKGTQGADDTDNTDDRGVQEADGTDNTDDRGVQEADATDNTDGRGTQEADDTDNTDDKGTQGVDDTDNTDDEGTQEADDTDNTDDRGTQGVDDTDNTDDRGVQGVDDTDNTDDKGTQGVDDTDNTDDKGTQGVDDTDNTDDRGTQGVDDTDNTDDEGTQGVDDTDNTDDEGTQGVDDTEDNRMQVANNSDNTDDNEEQEANDGTNTDDIQVQGADDKHTADNNESVQDINDAGKTDKNKEAQETKCTENTDGIAGIQDTNDEENLGAAAGHLEEQGRPGDLELSENSDVRRPGIQEPDTEDPSCLATEKPREAQVEVKQVGVWKTDPEVLPADQEKDKDETKDIRGDVDKVDKTDSVEMPAGTMSTEGGAVNVSGPASLDDKQDKLEEQTVSESIVKTDDKVGVQESSAEGSPGGTAKEACQDMAQASGNNLTPVDSAAEGFKQSTGDREPSSEVDPPQYAHHDAVTGTPVEESSAHTGTAQTGDATPAADSHSSDSEDSLSQTRQQRGQARRKRRGRGGKKRGGRQRQRNKVHEQPQQQPAVEKPKNEVMFHVLISEKFKQLKENNHHVYLCWRADDKKPVSGGFIEMHYKTGHGKSAVLYEAVVESDVLPWDNNNRLEYNYCVELDGNYEWEKLQKGERRARQTDKRVVERPQQEPRHRDVYDWVAYPAGMTGWTDSFKRITHLGTSSKDILLSDLCLATSLFLPSPDMVMTALDRQAHCREQTAADLLQVVEDIFNCLPFSSMQSREILKFFGESVKEHLWEPLFQPLKALTTSQGKRTVVLAVFLLAVAHRWNLNVEEKYRDIIFRGLLIKPDFATKTCPDLEDLHNQFPRLMEKRVTIFKQLVEPFLKISKGDNSSTWIYCIPLVHLLCGVCQPFCQLQASEDHRSTEWWGVAQLKDKTEAFKRDFKWNVSADTLFKDLKEVFVADSMMKRSFVATMNLNQLLKFLPTADVPEEIVLASVFYHLHTNPHAAAYHLKEIHDILRNTAATVKAKIKSSPPRPQEAGPLILIGAVGEDLLKEVVETHQPHSQLAHDVILLQLSIVTGFGDTLRQKYKRIDVIINNTKYYIQEWMKFRHRYCSDWETFVEMLEKCLEVLSENDEMTTQFEAMFCNFINTVLGQMFPGERLTHCLKLMERQGPFANVVSEGINTYLEQALSEQQSYRILNRPWSVLLQSSISSLFKAKWNELYPLPHGLLKLLCSWKPMSVFMRLCKGGEDARGCIPPEIMPTVEKMCSFLDKLLTKCGNGHVKIGDLQWLQQRSNKERFLEVASEAGYNPQLNSWNLQLRFKELEEFQKQAMDVCCALRHCGTFIKTSDAEQTNQEFRQYCGNLKDLRIIDICEDPCRHVGSIDIHNYNPRIYITIVPVGFQPHLPVLNKRLNSSVFCHILEETATAEQYSPDHPFWDVLVHVWHEAEAEWSNACRAMRSGNVTVEEAEKLFCVIEKNDKWYEKCRGELQKMADDNMDNWVEGRMEQFQTLVKLNTQREAAGILCQIQEEFGFDADVEDIKSFQDIDMTQPIGQLTPLAIQTSRALEDIKMEHVKYLRQFGSPKSSRFVNWVRDTMAGDGMKEVKVFVDLALNYVGDDPREVDKVRNLRAVVTGYAPLIFQTVGEATFLERCQEVVRNITEDPQLPAKFESTTDLISWFDHILKFHGSVEKTAMAQVESITRTGILKIGKLQQHNWTGNDVGFCDVICLEVPADEERKSEGHTYSYDALLDLQSRLMLVVGHEDQGKACVDRFVSVMDSVERLVKTYIQLCQDGCLLFLNWMVKFFFDNRGACCIVEFLQWEDTVNQMKGKQESSSLEDYMAMVAGFLDECHDIWQQYVEEQRRTFQEFNLYSMTQLVFLQEELANTSPWYMSPHVLPLLSLLQPGVVSQDLQAAKEASEADLKSESGEEEDEEGENADKEAVAAADFIKHMEENGLRKQLAVRALESGIEPTDFDEGLAWCMDHADSDDSDDEEEDDKHDTDGSSSALKGTIASALQLLNTSSGNLLPLEALQKCLTEVWTAFLQRVKFSGEDYISLHHLGSVLRALVKQVVEYNRKLPPPLSAETPNLIVCPKSEVLKVVTSIYMFTKEAPLPQPDEVLLCTPQTTNEEVKMFLHRAFTTSSRDLGKIHCLAFADSLDYDVGEQAEKVLKEFMNTSRHQYQLVVVCTSENEFNARIAASLERYSRPAPITAADADKMLDYLRCKFTVPEEESLSAARVDPERLCVRVVKSTRAGMGKTLYKKRLVEKLQSNLDSGSVDEYEEEESYEEESEDVLHVTVPLYEKSVNCCQVASTLLKSFAPSDSSCPKIIHLDIAYEVQEGVDHLLYNLLVLGCITDVHGHVWRRSVSDLYLVEAMPLVEHSEAQEQVLLHQIFSMLPCVKCCSPTESLKIFREKGSHTGDLNIMFDDEEYKSVVFQRPFHYLNTGQRRGKPQRFNELLNALDENDHEKKNYCLQTLIRHCGVKNPSWSELHHFVSFLNNQLEDFEHSIFCSSDLSEDLPGFPAFVLRFLIHMSKDFATRSLELAEETLPVLSQGSEDEDEDEDDNTDDTAGIEQFQMRKRWESSSHPYIFFNPDRTSMTFLGFTVHPQTGSLLDQAGQVMEKYIMRRCLYHSLANNGVPLSEDFDMLPRSDRLQRLYQVMGVPESERMEGEGEERTVVDPDNTYELTTDNAKKILAIYMRFRCDIPVIVMGETGCGKTRLVKFLCALQAPKSDATNTMIIMKVHGGTTAEDIYKKVKEAEAVAKQQKKSARRNHGPLYTVLFFDEANTTEAIGAIKEVMCDGAIRGKPIKLHQNLKMVAACNPYRKHSKAVIERLEKAGLGYHVSAEKTCDKLGRVPMRQLVYRVLPLPQSMLPLVWDFGQLDTETERMYIRQMVLRYVREGLLDADLAEQQCDMLCGILVEAQSFMRNRKDECSFVSLRDVDRTLMVMSWFLQQKQLLEKIDDKLRHWRRVADVTKALVLSLSVCYRAGLPHKQGFEWQICLADSHSRLLGDRMLFQEIIDKCQELLLVDVKLGEKIARNQALKENVFMMVVCVELGIPLFLVGKPGSSKSLAKVIVTDAMQGAQATGELFKCLKEAHMVSFQCSPLATADGILATFRQCAHIQRDKDKRKFVAVAVLDEIGLAEDSPRMPLKALHPLLEDGCEMETANTDEVESDWEDLDDDDSDPEAESDDDCEEDESMDEPKMLRSKQPRMEKVPLIGISNWALDPAKMNRGILVQRDVPDIRELEETALSICQSGEDDVLEHVESLVKKMAKAYRAVFEKATQQREFFGLRDFYSLVKMVHAIATQKNRKLTTAEFQAAVRRNFGGLDMDPVQDFEEHLDDGDLCEGDEENSTDSSYSTLLRQALKVDDGLSGESRYLLLLTENYGGLHILTDNLLNKGTFVPIFGSSFPKDQEYTQICRNINRIKVCMETGKTVVLLNSDNLYESLYDALNQYYSYLAKARYVDLGLGTHRVKCKVETNFRLIVVAEKQTVYDKFPIPLINRLEKHFLSVNSLLNEEQHRLERLMNDWILRFVGDGMSVGSTEPGQLKTKDCLIGYHSDTAASIVLSAWEKHVTPGQSLTPDAEEKILLECRSTLLWCATPDAVIRLQDEWCSDVYFNQQQHGSLAQYLQASFSALEDNCLMVQKSEIDRPQDGVAAPVEKALSLDLAQHLLSASVQGAVAKIQDGTYANGRSTHRIAVLLHWLEDRGTRLFVVGVLRMVSAVLQEREDVCYAPRDSCHWLEQDAAKPKRVKRAGTLRRAWMQTLEEYLIPVLGGVVAYLDTNNNLDLLQTETEEDMWIVELWLKFLNTPDLCNLHYQDLLSMSGHPSQLKEFPCRRTFLANGSVTPALPFSWVMFEEIETFLAKSSVASDVDIAYEDLEGSVLGGFLRESITTDDIAGRFVQQYLADLLHVHFRLTLQEHELLLQCLSAALRQEGVEVVQAHGLSRTLVKIHQVLGQAKPRLQHVLDMAACHGHAIQNLQEKRRDPQAVDPVVQSELVEDVLLLEILTQELTPQKNQLSTDKGIKDWLDLFSLVAPVISRVLADADSHPSDLSDGLEEGVLQTACEKQWVRYGDWCCNHIVDIRYLWTRVSVVKLFIDYMSPLVSDPDCVRLEPINYNLLWNCLTNKANLKTKATLKNVDKYIKHANGQMVKKLLGNVGICAYCAVKLEGPPTVLPCHHRICDKCYTQEVRPSRKCPECHEPVVDLQPDNSGGSDREAVDKLVNFQKQTSAFLMAMISQLCFSGQEPPEPDAVEHIFSYIIRRVEGVKTLQTQQLTLRDDQMDPSPVFRSFILRLLLKHSETEVSRYIDSFLSEAETVIEQHIEGQSQQSSVLNELSLLIIHCTENLKYEMDAVLEDEEDMSRFPSQCDHVKKQLQSVRIRLEASPRDLSTLIAVGQLRHALSACARLLQTCIARHEDGHEMDLALKDMLLEASVICIMGTSPWPKKFLVKQLCRDYGLQSYAKLMELARTHRSLQWISLDNVQQVEEVSDRYLICGNDYHRVREALMQELRDQLGQLQTRLDEINCSARQKQYLLLLALHREVFMAFISASDHSQVNVRDRAAGLVKDQTLNLDQEMAVHVVANQLGVPDSKLCVRRGESVADQSLICILVHLWLALRVQSHRHDLLTTLLTIIEQPAQMKTSYLPTMPQDNVDEIVRALGIDQSKGLDYYNEWYEVPKLWQCPNGHRYAIGDCGNPSGVGRCPECGARIGALSYHVAAEGNVLSQVRDQSKPGHILGAVADRSRDAVPERGMSAAACALVRFLTHACLCISASQHGQAATVSQMTQPAVTEQDVTQFFWGHLCKDMQVLQRALGRSCDDVYLLLHHLCHQIAVQKPVHFWHPTLGTMRVREDWERQFSQRYVHPVLQQMDAVIRNGNGLILSDTRQGQKQLLNVVFEVGEEEEDVEVGTPLQHTATAWKYRARITVEQFFRQFQLHVQSNGGANSLPVLQLFCDQRHHLQALYYIPDILRLQHRLMQQLCHRLSRTDASKRTVRDLLEDKENHDLQKLVEVFSKAWDIVKDHLISYRCRNAEGVTIQLPEEYHTVCVNENSPVGVLLPDMEGPGRCAYILVHFLLVQHNHFLQLFSAHTRTRYDQLPEVQLHAVTQRHLVGFSMQNDLLPLVLSHCNYSLHLGHGDNATSTKLDYDFRGFELQLKSNLLLSKCWVHRGEHGDMQIETMSYCADITNSRLINRLRDKIPQVPLKVRVQIQIIAELQESLPDICHSIDSINTALTFLLTLKVTPDQSLHSFLADTLRMRDGGLHSREIQQHCRVKHVQSLWLLLCFLRARILASDNQEAFDDQGQELRKELTEEQTDSVIACLQRLSADRVELVFSLMYQCIVLHLFGHSHDEEFASPDNMDLKWLLCDALDNPPYSETENAQYDTLSAEELDMFPPSVLASQSIPTWLLVHTHLNTRQ